MVIAKPDTSVCNILTKRFIDLLAKWTLNLVSYVLQSGYIL
jgi:hypothetical protein